MLGNVPVNFSGASPPVNSKVTAFGEPSLIIKYCCVTSGRVVSLTISAETG
ncbi:MAG: hypothetical protein HMLKMBBP_03668 [Planctomycetes bacterium]|nr:hypothetical protein [Planctomycetota bacterium]